MPIFTDITLLKMRRTKIVATIGPASADPETIVTLMAEGVNVFRLNMSHGSREGHRNAFQVIRESARRQGRPIAVLADLSGPKIRVGKFSGGAIQLVQGTTVTVTTRDQLGSAELIPSQYVDLARDVNVGDRILMDDGNLELSVKEISGNSVICGVVTGGILKDHKGINLPGVEVSAPALTDKDRDDATFAVELGVDWLALSFVRRAIDVQTLREHILSLDSHLPIIAKIEKPEALENIDDILAEVQGIMVARGDLGVELSPEKVPAAQDELILLARRHRKPVIVATQMLESMIEHPRPTRAEVSDVAHAVTSGADAIMLTGETAVGDYPIDAVKMMNSIALQAEAILWQRGAFEEFDETKDDPRPIPVDDAVAEATALLSRDLRVRAIVVVSFSGRSIGVTSASRQAAPILGITTKASICRASCLLWGVIPLEVSEAEIARVYTMARKQVKIHELAEEGQSMLVLRGFNTDPKKNTPSVSVLTV